MSSVSENVFDIYSSTFYQCVVVIGLIVVTINMIWEIGTGSFNYRNAVIDVWALITYNLYRGRLIWSNINPSIPLRREPIIIPNLAFSSNEWSMGMGMKDWQ